MICDLRLFLTCFACVASHIDLSPRGVKCGPYDGFNLLYLNNHDNSRKLLPPGIYALSNHLLDSPWPKVDHTRDQLKQAISPVKMGAEQLPNLIATLSLEKVYAPELLPNTGVPAQWEGLLSSPFIVADGPAQFRFSRPLSLSESPYQRPQW